MAGNPNWQKGMTSPNPGGNIKYRERFKQLDKRTSLEKKIAIYLTKKWGRMVNDIDTLTEKDRVKAFIELLQYSMPKKAPERPDAITAEQVDDIYGKILELSNPKHGYAS